MTDHGEHSSGRARSFAELVQVLPKTGPSQEQISASKPYNPQSGDVIITPFGKCGTTMMQQMFHQLRMAPHGGDMNFDDISRVVPWIETAPELELDINAEQRAKPRGFKSHLHYEGLPLGLRYVVTLRPPDEALVSLYHFFSGWFFEPGTISIEEFVPVWLWERPDRPNYYTHLLSWWARRDTPDTLLMDYRAVLKNKRDAIRRLADFCDIAADQAAIDLVENRTSRDFMMEHKAPFADPMMRRMTFEKANLPMDSDSAKIRAKDAERVPLPKSVFDQLDAIWAEQVEPVTGHSNYASLVAALTRD